MPVPLLVDIAVAIVTTKVPILFAKGFWPMEAETRADYAMLLGLLFLLVAGAGRWSGDATLSAKDFWPLSQSRADREPDFGASTNHEKHERTGGASPPRI